MNTFQFIENTIIPFLLLSSLGIAIISYFSPSKLKRIGIVTGLWILALIGMTFIMSVLPETKMNISYYIAESSVLNFLLSIATIGLFVATFSILRLFYFSITNNDFHNNASYLSHEYAFIIGGIYSFFTLKFFSDYAYYFLGFNHIGASLSQNLQSVYFFALSITILGAAVIRMLVKNNLRGKTQYKFN